MSKYDAKFKYHSKEENSRGRKCQSCGAENEQGVKNCIYCGATLVDIKMTDTEDAFMGPDEMLKKALMAFRQFLTGTIKDVSKVNNERMSKDSRRLDKNSVILIVILAVLIVAMLAIGISTVFGFFYTFTMQSMVKNTNNADSMSTVLTVINFVRMSLLFVGFIAFCIGLFVVFRRRKTKTTTFKIKCPSCGGNNKAESKICAFCGGSLEETMEETEDSDIPEQMADALKDFVVDMANKGYDMQDKRKDK